MRRHSAEVQFLARASGWTFFGHEIAAGAARRSRSTAGAIGATGIVVPSADRSRGARARDGRDGVTARAPKGALITGTASVVVERVFAKGRAWRISVPRI